MADDEGASQTKLVEHTRVDRSTLADIVRRLVRKGLPQRRRTREDCGPMPSSSLTKGDACSASPALPREALTNGY